MSAIANKSSSTDTFSVSLVWIGIIIFASAILYSVFYGNVNHDEVEHLAVSFRIATGDSPYQDFYQNHLPFYWYVLIPLVDKFTGTLIPLFVARTISIVLVAVIGLIGSRILKHINGPRAIIYPVYIFTVLALIPSMEMHRVRPDVMMFFFASLAFYLMASVENFSKQRSFFIGFFMMIAACFSLKMAFLCGIFPILVCVGLRKVRWPDRFNLVVFYGLGILLGLLPIVLYFYSKGLLPEFYEQIIRFNSELKKRNNFTNFRLSSHISFFACFASVLFSYLKREQLSQHQRQIFLVTGLWIILGYAIFILSCHPSFYNIQIILIPAAFSITFLFVEIHNALRPGGYSIILSLWFVIQPSLETIPKVYNGSHEGDQLKLRHLKKLIALSPDAKKTCIGFAPIHPIYCKNVSQLMLSWDLEFFRRLKKNHPMIVAAWREAIVKATSGEVDIIAWKNNFEIWRKARNLGAFTPAEYQKLLDIESLYESKSVDRWKSRVWVRRDLVDIENAR